MFHHDFQTLENNKSTQPKRPRAFICFLVFGNRDETLVLVFEIVLNLTFAAITDLTEELPGVHGS